MTGDGAAASSGHRSVAPSGQELQPRLLQGAPQGARIEACRPLSSPTALCLRAVSWLARSSARSLPQAIGAVGPAPGASFDLGRSSRSLKFYLTEWKLSLGTTSPVRISRFFLETLSHPVPPHDTFPKLPLISRPTGRDWGTGTRLSPPSSAPESSAQVSP